MGDQPGNYPARQTFWSGGEYLNLGSGIYYKTILIKIQVYTVAIYIEAGPALKKAKELQQAGFFKNTSDANLASFIGQKGFRKALHLKLLRDVSMNRFTTEMTKDLGPRVKKTGNEKEMKQFIDYLQTQQIQNDCSLACVWDEDDTLSGGLFPPGFNDWQNAKPPMAIKNAGFCKAMFDMYIDDKTVVKPTRAIWAKSIAALPSQ